MIMTASGIVVNESHLQNVANDPTKFSVIGDVCRPGVRLFMVRLEYIYYPPLTEANKLFDVFMVEWPRDTPFGWAVLTFPIEDREKAELLAKETGLRFANGVPTLLGDGIQVFPMQGERVWTLENTPGHPVYQKNPEAIQKMVEEHDAEIIRIIRQHCEKHGIKPPPF